MDSIRVAIVGVGNCASALGQGIGYYRSLKENGGKEATRGLINGRIGPYSPGDIEIVAAFDIDSRKVGKRFFSAIYEKPNCTPVFFNDFEEEGPEVKMSPVMDGYPEHMKDFEEERVFLPADNEPDDVRGILKDSGAEVLVNFLPVGSYRATEFYAEACLDLGISMANCIPVFIASKETWAEKFKEKNVPIIGDDVKSQLGATIIHRALSRLFSERGISISRTYQLNTGGNTDFLNMLNRERLESKKVSKTESVRSVISGEIPKDNIHVGPSDYVPWQKDNKVCFIRIEGDGFAGAPMELELRLSVLDSPNSAGVVIDVVRCLKLALDAGIGGPLVEPSSYFMKHPPVQYPDEEAKLWLEHFIDRALNLERGEKGFLKIGKKPSPR